MSNSANKSGRPKKGASPFTSIFRDLITGLNQQEAAAKIGVARQNIGRWISGETTPDIDTLGKIATAFDVSTDYLLGRTLNKTTDTTLKAVCEYTGLSEKSVENITQIDGTNKEIFNIFCETELEDWLEDVTNYALFHSLKLQAASAYRACETESPNASKMIRAMKEAEKLGRFCMLSFEKKTSIMLTVISGSYTCWNFEMNADEYTELLKIANQYSNIEFEDALPIYKEIVQVLQDEIKDGENNG